MRTFRAARSFVAGFSCALIAGVAFGQQYPSKPVRIIVPSTPGVSTDLIPRAVAPVLAKILGQAVVVENKPGAGMMLAFEYVAKQVPADGYTVAMVSVADLVLYPLTVKDVRFDALKDLPPLVDISEGPYFLNSSATLPWKSFPEMVAYARANPGKLNYGASSPSTRLPMVTLFRELGIDAVYIPYNSGAPYIQGVVSGEVHLGLTSEATVVNFKEKVNALAATGNQRRSTFPNVPTLTELGYPNVKAAVTFSFNLPAGTSKPIVDRLNAAANQALQTPEVKSFIAKFGYEAVGGTAEFAANRLADSARAFADAARAAGIRPE
jgi:tripartite-type tricarboxylate transporter receptor subunit TctC